MSKHYAHYICVCGSFIICLLLLIDLTTYDTVKQTILRNTSLKDNALTHSMSRYRLVVIMIT